MNSTPTTAITIDSYLPGHGSIAERDVRIRSHRDVRRGLWEKLSDSYHGRYTDPASQWLGEYAGIFFFWFVAISEIYLLSTFLLPYRFPHASDMDIYYWKVAIYFVFIQSAANWLCLRFFASFYTEKSKDQPRFDQMTDWERHIRGITKDCKEAMPGSRFGWGFCSKCQQSKPPRAHHCPVCERCVLKRDHHCYMTGVCVGYYNQRYFVIFTFYVALASTLGLYFCWGYFYQELYPQHPGMWWFLPVTFIKFVYGSLDHYQLLIIVHLYSLLFAGSMAAGFFIWQLVIIGLGKTDNEIRSKANVRSVTSVAANFRSVFGILWPVNFLFPGVIVFRQEDSGLHWEGLKPL